MFFKIISKKKYKEMENIVLNYNINNYNYESTINRLNESLSWLRYQKETMENNNTQLVKELNKRIEELEHEIAKLVEDNTKSTTWINEILETNKTCKVNNIEPITIPVYKESSSIANYANDEPVDFALKEMTIIPEIRLVKIK